VVLRSLQIHFFSDFDVAFVDELSNIFCLAFLMLAVCHFRDKFYFTLSSSLMTTGPFFTKIFTYSYAFFLSLPFCSFSTTERHVFKTVLSFLSFVDFKPLPLSDVGSNPDRFFMSGRYSVSLQNVSSSQVHGRARHNA
jgi:hypothetical protein